MQNRILMTGVALAALMAAGAAQAGDAKNTDGLLLAQATTPDPGMGGAAPAPAPAATPADPNLFSTISDAAVETSDGTNVADVDDLLLDTGGQAKFVVLGEGGVLGVGTTYRIQAIDKLPKVSDEKADLALTEEAVTGLAEYTYPEAEGRAATDTAPTPGGAGNPAATTGSTTPAPATTAAGGSPESLFPASQIIGLGLMDGDDEVEVSDLRFDESGKITHYILDEGGHFGLGENDTELDVKNVTISGTPAEPTLAYSATPKADTTMPKTDADPAAPATEMPKTDTPNTGDPGAAGGATPTPGSPTPGSPNQ